VFVTCDNCGGRFRIAPEKVPATGIRARCAGCSSILVLRREGDGVVVAPTAPRHSLPPPQPVPDPEVDLPPDFDAGGAPTAAADAAAGHGAADHAAGHPAGAAGHAANHAVGHETGRAAGDLPPPPPPDTPPAPPPLPPAAFPDEDSPWGALPTAEAPPPPPPPPGEEDDPFASLEAPPLPEELSFGDLAGIPEEEVKEPSFVTGAVALPDEASPAASPVPAPAAVPRQRTASRLHLASAARKAPVEGPVSKAIWSVLVVGALIYGVLVGLHRDPTGPWDELLPGSGGAPLRSRDVTAGLYPAADGGRLTYLVGTVEGRARGGEGVGIRITGELLDAKGGVVSRSEGWAGALPSPEALAAVADEASWVRLSRELARGGARDGMPFVVAFPGAKAAGGGAGFRITLREEPLPLVPDAAVVED